MSNNLKIKYQKIDGPLDTPLESATFARMSVEIRDRILSRCADRKTGIRDEIRIPLHQLAAGIVTNWWTMLYEPWRPEDANVRGKARHHLDAFVNGFLFPSVAIWSAGRDAITIATGRIQRLDRMADRLLTLDEHNIATRMQGYSPISPRSLSTIEFVDENRDYVNVTRQGLEETFFNLVEDVINWIRAENLEDAALFERWESVVKSRNDPEERSYCMAAGCLGFDPYDCDTPDISIYAASIPEDTFTDLCESANFNELASASNWLSYEQSKLANAPTIDVAEFGPSLPPNLHQPAWKSGYKAATALRQQLSLGDNPQNATDRLLGVSSPTLLANAPAMVEGLLFRNDNSIKYCVQGQSNAQARFRGCRALYLGWMSEPGSHPLLTTASTYNQQASRAFAAELLCPADHLHSMAGNNGLTSDQITEIAINLDCQEIVVHRQAQNHGIPVRGQY